MPPKTRIRIYEPSTKWTEPCDRCADGKITFDDGAICDGVRCYGCSQYACDDCTDNASGKWTWIDCTERWKSFCPACVAAAPLHDEATCEKCIGRAEQAASDRQQAAEMRKQERLRRDTWIWPTMLECIRGVSDQRATAIATAYPSPARIVDACTAARKRGADDIDLLADIPLPSGKRLGRAVAKSVHQALFADHTAS